MDVLLVDGEGVMWAYHPETMHEMIGTAERVHSTSSTTFSKPTNDLERSKPEVGQGKHLKDKENIINVELST